MDQADAFMPPCCFLHAEEPDEKEMELKIKRLHFVSLRQSNDRDNDSPCANPHFTRTIKTYDYCLSLDTTLESTQKSICTSCTCDVEVDRKEIYIRACKQNRL